MIRIAYHIVEAHEPKFRTDEPTYQQIEDCLNVAKEEIRTETGIVPRLVCWEVVNNYKKSTIRKAVESTWQI